MKTLPIRRTLAVLIAFAAVAGCVNIHVYLYDETQAREAAQQLVSDIRGGSAAGEVESGTTTSPAEENDKNGAFLFFRSSAAYAATIDIEKENPLIRKIKEELKAADLLVLPFLADGSIGEATTGELALRKDERELDPRQRAEIRKHLKKVNDLRIKLYEEVIRSQNVAVDPENLKVTRDLFAAEWRKWTDKGWFYMDPKTRQWTEQKKSYEERGLKKEK